MSARLNADIDDLLRHALRVAGNGGVPDDNLRAAAKRVCGMAHAQDLRAEELIIVLKGRWYRLPEVTKRRASRRR